MDPAELAKFNTLLLMTDLGRLDVLREIAGVGNYDQLKSQIVEMEVEGEKVPVLDLDPLIAAKKAAGREKDKLGVMYLEAVKKRRPRS
jgi:hypothetical protein